MKNKTLRVALYVRVSTEDQKNFGLSVENQIDALYSYADANGYEVADLYNDAGISARKRYTKRPELLRLLKDCQAGKIDLILFTKLDRWFRSVSSYYQVQDILDRCRVPWRAIWDDYETQTADGVLKVNIMLSVAQSEADKDSERVKATIAYKFAKGLYHGAPPTGYKLEKSVLYKNEEREGTEAFFATYLSTFSNVAAIRAAAAYGLIIDTAQARYMLRNDIYTGSRGAITCDPYITEEQHRIIINSLNNRRSKEPARAGRVYLFTGLIKCGYCGRNFMSKVIPRNGKDYFSYHCAPASPADRCGNGAISELKLEKYLLDNLDNIIADLQISASSNGKEEKDKRQKIAALNAKLKRIGDRYEEGDITLREYKNKRAVILADISQLQHVAPSVPEPFPEGWEVVYNSLDRQHKKAFWNTIIKEIRISKGAAPVVFFN